MASRVRTALLRVRRELRYEPTEKRVRAEHGGAVALESDRALLVWEPRRILPSYAVPEEDVTAELSPASGTPPEVGQRAFLHGGDPFEVRITEGEALDVETEGERLEGAAFRPSDPDLSGYVIFDFHGLSDWYEEDERIVGHPRDPFHRVDIRRSSRRVRVELDGTLLAESARPTLVFETGLPVRFYLHPDELRVVTAPSPRRTYCAYKGEASYRSVTVGARVEEDLVWSYEDPLRDARQLTGRICFWGERVDHIVDGKPYEGDTDVGATLLEEAGIE